MLKVDVSKKLGEFTLEAAFTSEGRVTGLFGASGQTCASRQKPEDGAY